MKKEKPAIQIGTVLYYQYNPKPYTVTGETSRSWLVRQQDWFSWQESTKIPKNALPPGWFLDQKQWSDFQFAQSYKYAIAERLKNFATPEQIVAIAHMIGFKPPEAPR